MNSSNIVNPDLSLLTQPLESIEVRPFIEEQREEAIDSDSSEMTEGINSLWEGISGLMFTLSLIFLIASPLISVGIIGILLLGYMRRTPSEI